MNQPVPPAAIATLRTALDQATLVDDNPAYILGKLLTALSRDGWQIVPAGAAETALLARVRELEAELAGMTDLRDRAIARQDQLRAENERLAIQAHSLRITCATCDGPVGYVDCPTGGWWAHEQHPADGHDAEPVQPGTQEV